MAHPAYKDDPEEHTFTAFEQYLYDMSNQWRLLVHRYENILDKKESRAGQTTIMSPSNMVVFECEMNIAELSSLVFAKPDKAKG